MQKFEYKGTNKNLDDFYINDPSNYALYNIVDVALLVRLNEKLKHIELHNLLRRMQKTPYTRSLVGNSALFDAYILSKLSDQDKKIRHGMSTENSSIFKIEDFKGISQPKTKKTIVKPLEINASEFREVTMKFDGAYVKDSKNKIITSGLIMDLDATALYPSMINQSNIGFDTYRARIISPLTYVILNYLDKTLGNIQEMETKLSTLIWDATKKFVDDSSMPNKTKAKTHWYYLCTKLIKSVYDSKFKLKQIMNPSCDKESIILTKYLIPFLDILNNIHSKRKEYNYFVYDYIFDDNEESTRKKYPFVYVIKDINSPGMYIEKLSFDDTLKFINQYSLTITGCMFTKHEDYLGLFTETLINLKAMRKKYKNKMFEFEKGSDNFNFWNSRQLSVKIVMNSIYGVSGLKTFRYSNHWLAQSITTSGRLANKLAQYLAEEHLKQRYGKEK